MKTPLKDKRTEILKAGAEVMLRKGYHGTGVQEIVNGAGIPKGSFYHYFQSKEDFVASAMEHASFTNIARLESALQDEGSPPRQRIINTYADMVATIEANRDFTKGCFVGNMCQELADTHTVIAKKAEELFQRYTTPLACCIQQAQAIGEISPKAEPEMLAEAIFNSWEGAIMRMKSSRNSRPLSAFMDMLHALLS